MFVSCSLLSFLLLSFSLPVNSAFISRDSPVKFPLKKRLNPDLGSFKNLAVRDAARAKHMRSRGHKLLSTIADVIDEVPKLIRDEVHNEEVANSIVFYTASIGVGTPPKTYEVLVDTGSSNTWVGAQSTNPYVVTNSSVKTPNTVSVEYGSGSFSGNEYLDRVTLSSDLVLVNQSIGAATTSQGLDVDGILGIGPKDLTRGTLNPTNRSTIINTVTDTAFALGLVDHNEVGIYFEPLSSPSNGTGQLTYGGVDNSKLNGTLTFTNVTSAQPANVYWGIDQKIVYNNELLLSSAGVIDTGTTLTLIATDAFDKYRDAVGAVFDEDTGMLRINNTQFDQLQSLVFQIGGANFELTPDAQLWPRTLNTAIGGSSDFLYLIIADIGTPSGLGLDFINGYTFLERFYTSYDSTNKQVGFAPTPFTNSVLNRDL